MARDRLIVAIAGDSGAVYGVRALEALRRNGSFETHLIVDRAAIGALSSEAGLTPSRIGRLADVTHDAEACDAAPFAPGFETRGLLVAPCSMETLRLIADEDEVSLVARAAGFCLTAQRRVALLVPETPLDLPKIQLMATAARRGCVIVPPVPAFYHRPRTIDDIVDQTVGRALDLFDIDAGLVRRWTEGDPSAP